MILKLAQRVVIKIGSSLVTNHGKGLDLARLSSIAKQIAYLKSEGKSVVLVSSGAIAEGMQRLNWSERPNELYKLQAAAAVGQMGLAQTYESCFQEYKLQTAQLLLTHEDLADRKRYLNIGSTFCELLDLGVVPIVNENDTVATDEIRVGDNDRLAGIVSNLINAQALVLLSDVEGLMTAPPSQSDSKLISEVKSFDDLANIQIGGAGNSGVGSGGMSTKVQAARIATAGGIPALVTSAVNLGSVFEAKNVGTVFWPNKDKLSARLLWLAHATEVRGFITIDQGAVIAVTQKRASLLPAGIKKVAGEFEVGDAVEVISESGEELGRGLVNFDSSELPNLIGKNTVKLLEEFGEGYDKEVIHRDDLVLIDEKITRN